MSELAQNMNKIEKVETVFKEGMGYDPVKLIESVRAGGFAAKEPRD